MKIAVLVFVALLAIAGCGGEDSSGPAAGQPSGEAPASGEPRTEKAVSAMAQEQLDRFASQDHGGVWDMWSEAGKASISREDYISLGEECDLGGIPLDLDSVRLESEDKAVIRIALGDFSQSYDALYEDGAWRWQPTANAIESYSLGYPDAAGALREEGACND